NNGGSRTSLPKSLELNCHKNRLGHSDVYGILDINKPSITITGGCMSYSKGRFGHPTQNRALSAREAARLQSFDDDYIFVGNRGQLAKQIGNAVPVKLAQASGNYFMSVYREIANGQSDN
ncbi:TPA: DNA cytosine methyltransferase, partial [Streptococcus pneumoniae]|nr:DNA cytosine methyltransferase [Streptococcus pneumoniae]